MAAAFGWGTLAASSLVIGALVALRLRHVGVVTTLGFAVAFTIHTLD
jgi:hypothetical protein